MMTSRSRFSVSKASAMAAPLLSAKLHIPHARPGLVSRPRLVEKLDAGLRCKLALISALAGSGKTTLLSEWLARLRGMLRKLCDLNLALISGRRIEMHG
jgi:hypothetical protein